MEKVKLTSGLTLDIDNIYIVDGTLEIVFAPQLTHTVEELVEIFSDKSATSHIVILTESGKESGFKTGFTSFAGIRYTADGYTIVELFQPKDVTEQRISKAEGAAHAAENAAESVVYETSKQYAQLEEQNAMLIECILEMSELVYG